MVGRALCLASLLAAGAAVAEEPAVVLADGPGRDAVEQNCSACHSLDYIQMNSRFADAKLWEAEVAKMVNAFGAPVDPKDAKTITDYLAKHYGK
jgi:cytochrome c5